MLPIKDLNCFSVLGFCHWIIASVFHFGGLMPSELILYPNQVISVRPNWHLCKLMARFSLSNLSRVSSIPFTYFSSVPFEMIIMSSGNALLEFIPSSLVSIIFWNVAGRSLDRRSLSEIYVFQWRFLLICWNCNVCVYQGVVVVGYWHIWGLFYLSIVSPMLF